MKYLIKLEELSLFGLALLLFSQLIMDGVPTRSCFWLPTLA